MTVCGVNAGLKLFIQERPTIVLIDYHMPDINGVEGVRRLRQLSATVPIIVFTIDECQKVADEFLAASSVYKREVPGNSFELFGTLFAAVLP